MDNLLLKFINNPYNDINNFDLGYEYEEIGQTASALSYYLRCAEFTENKNLAYEALLRMSLCLSKQGGRETMELTCIQHAISLLSERPEGNYLISLYYSYREKWMEAYMFACNGLSNDKDFIPFRKDFIYKDKYQLEFQKAYTGNNKGKNKEAYMIYNQLVNDNKINEKYRELILSNLENLPKIDYSSSIKKSKIIGIDVGACIGETIDDFKDCDIIYAIEPGKDEYNVLKTKYKDDKRIIPINCAITEQNGERELICYENGRFSSFLELNKDGDFYKFCEENTESFDIFKEKINVETQRLDTLIEKYKIEEIEYLKVDTQGTDLNVIKSLGKYINIVRKIQLEVQLKELYINSSTKDEIMEYMNDNNFKLIDTIYGLESKEYENDLIFLNKNLEIENITETIIEYDNFNKLDIVLQGGINDDILDITNYYLELPFVNKIIISCWEDNILPYINDERIIVIQNKSPSCIGTGNRNLQIISSLNGLKKVETEFSIKLRNDQKYDKKSMMKMYYFYQKYKDRKKSFYYNENKPKNRICVAGNFAEFSFHPRDHLFWGNTQDLIDLFSLPLDSWAITDKIKLTQPGDYSLYYDYYIRSETYIGSHYLANFDRMINNYLLDPKKYLYDNSECYKETKLLSDKLTSQIFKSFPREGIDLEWKKYNWKKYPYKNQREKFGERWHEDGF